MTESARDLEGPDLPPPSDQPVTAKYEPTKPRKRIAAREPMKVEIPAPVTQSASCPCGTAFEQTGTHVGDGVVWFPKTCPACMRREALAEKAEAERLKAEAIAAKWEAVWARLEIPPAYRGLRFEAFKLYAEGDQKRAQKRLIEKGIQYLGIWPDMPDMVVLRGSFGTGKTAWAWTLAQHVAFYHGSTVRFATWADVMREIRSTWRGGNPRSELAVLNLFRGYDLLVIDELSRHAFYGEPHQHLYDILAHRIQWGRPTVITSNEDEAGLRDLLGGAIADRMKEAGGYLPCEWPSYRGRRREAQIGAES